VIGGWIIRVQCRASHGVFMERVMNDYVPLDLNS